MRGPPRGVLAAIVLLAGSDVAYVSMFNSFYTESPSLIFVVWILGLALATIVRGASPRWTLPLFFVAAALFMAAKPQNFILAVPLAGLVIEEEL